MRPKRENARNSISSRYTTDGRCDNRYTPSERGIWTKTCGPSHWSQPAKMHPLMSLKEQKIPVRELSVGMYVCRLDRDWDGTPFPVQGVLIRSEADIDTLSKYCSEVFIDTGFGPPPQPRKPESHTLEWNSRQDESIDDLQHHVFYKNTIGFEDEVSNAQKAQEIAAEFTRKVLGNVQQGLPLDAEQVRCAIEPMVESILHNVDAFLWVESLRKRDSYDYDHAMICSALSAAFARDMASRSTC